MQPDWKEIFIESERNSLLKKSENKLKSISSTKISPIETIIPNVEVIREKQKNKKFVYYIFLFLLVYQTLLAYFIKIFYINEDSKFYLKASEKYLDVIEDTVSSDMSYILQDAKKYWTLLKFLKTENYFKLEKIYFSQNENYLYFGVFQKVGKELYSKLEFFNHSLLGNSKISLDEFSEKIEGIEISLFSPTRDGVPYLYNLTEKKDKSEICMAIIPTENEILVLGFQLKKWNELLAKREIGAYILLNHQGVVLAHSSPEIAKSVTDYSNLKYFDFIRKGGELYKKKEFISPTGKKVEVLVRKLLPFESYLVYLVESENKENNYWLFYLTFSFIGFGIAFLALKKIY